MPTEISIYVGVGERNLGQITAFANPVCLADEVGSITGSSHGWERLKLCNSIVNLPEIPNIARIASQLRKGNLQSQIAELSEQYRKLEQGAA